ncbi:GspH/FimT family pseudopilin [Candidatus Electrothrix sp.]|uniref:GspH/FimT family pseudopilin n=2 Tax=Candidatus Electrothrix sp. TaxID=2170559 RepID=UPI004055F26C
MKMRRKISDSRGFSFYELMIVIAIIGILSAIALPSFLRSLPEKRLKNAARNLYVDLQKARLLAVKENTNITFTFDTAAGQYIFPDGGTMVTESLTDYGAVRYGCDIATNDWNGDALGATTKTTFTDDTVRFGTTGAVEMDDGTGTFQLLTQEEGAALQSENDQTVCYAATVSRFGSVKIYRYNGSAWVD